MENTQLIVDLNAIKFETKKQVIAINKKRNELSLLEEMVQRYKKTESLVKNELNALQTSKAPNDDFGI